MERRQPGGPLRILHVGSGFRPWRRGGLVAYVEDLIEEQTRRGDDPIYLFSGRLYPLGRTRLRRWRRGLVPMLEIVNSPLYDHGRQPDREQAEPRTERIFEAALRELEPDVVHVHELAGLPFSILDICRATGVPAVFTLQDYFPLCPTFRLLDAEGRTCLEREVGEECMAATAVDPRPPELLFWATARHGLHGSRIVRRLPAALRKRLVSGGISLYCRAARLRNRFARADRSPRHSSGGAS